MDAHNNRIYTEKCLNLTVPCTEKKEVGEILPPRDTTSVDPHLYVVGAA